MARDFTYIDDVVEGVLRTLERPPRAIDGSPPYAIYNIGNHFAVPLDSYIGILETLLARRALRNERPMQPGDVKATYASIERLQRDTGFTPSTPLTDGLARFVDWYRRYYPAP
jgi:UDP-glucuronate 4-epimerase